MNITHRNPIQRRHLLLAGASLAAAGLPSLASAAKANAAASTWPSKPIRLIVPYPAGGINDVVARMLGDQMGQTLGQPFVVDNKPGAGATIGMAELAKADDQHTFAFGAISPLTLNPYLMKVAYDPMHDIIPVASVMYAPSMCWQPPPFAAAALPMCWRKPRHAKVSAWPLQATARWRTSWWSSSSAQLAASLCTSPTKAAADW